MLEVGKNEKVIFNRGDLVSFTLFINQGTELNPIRYYLGDSDKVVFSFMYPNGDARNAIFQVECYNGHNWDFTMPDDEKFPGQHADLIITLTGNLTKNLVPGDYCYEIKLYQGSDENKQITIVDKTQIVLLR